MLNYLWRWTDDKDAHKRCWHDRHCRDDSVQCDWFRQPNSLAHSRGTKVVQRSYYGSPNPHGEPNVRIDRPALTRRAKLWVKSPPVLPGGGTDRGPKPFQPQPIFRGVFVLCRLQ